MGTQLIKGYTIEKDPIGFAGVNSSWSMYQGHKSDGDKQAVTVFTFSKKAVEKLPKNQREEYLAGIRREATSLAKYRHPSILRIIEPLVEDPKSMAFVTEQVDASLMNLINGSRSLEVYSTELDTKFHLMDLIEAISFLHNDIKTAHLGISPENIYLTTSGKWKLSGFVFSTQVVSEKVAECQLVDFSSKANASHELKVTPNIAFTAPELVEFPAKCSLASDMFSLGCLLYSIFKIAKDGNAKAPYIVNASSYTGYKECIKYVEKEDLSFIPDGLRHIVSRMIKYDMANRCKISDFSSLAYFNDPLIQTIKYLETLYQRDIQQQQAFLKGLQKIMLKFEPKFIKKKVLPILANLMKTPQLSTCIIPIYISILENKDNLSFKKDDFDYLIWPSTKTLAQGKEMPAQSLYLLVLNLKLISEFITIEDVNNIFVSLIIKCFECNVAKLQRTALKNVEFLTKKLEYSQIKTKILPRILMLCVDNNIEVRKSAILTLQKTFTIFDRTTINDQILTTLEKVRKMGNNQAINMAVLKIFEGVASIIGIDVRFARFWLLISLALDNRFENTAVNDPDARGPER